MDGQDWSANPFQDPSVQRMALSQPGKDPTAPNSGVGESDMFNPFAPTHPATSTAPVQHSTVTVPTTRAPPATKDTELTFSALADRERELNQKEEDLKQKQKELEERENDLARRAANGKFLPNWPPFPAWMPKPFKPFLFHSIQQDIPSEMQGTMYNMFGLWYVHCFCYVVNVIAALAGTACNTCDDTGSNLALAILFMCIGIPISFKMWYRVLYNGLKKDRGVNFVVFFFVFGFQILVNVYFTFGFEGTGACGWVAAIEACRGHFAIAFFYIISALSWSVCTTASVYMIMKVHRWYRGTDYTLENAQAEIARDIRQNPTAQQAVLRSAF